MSFQQGGLQLGHSARNSIGSQAADSSSSRARQVSWSGWLKPTYSQLLLLGQEVVALIPLIQGDQDVLEPVTHAQGEFAQLRVQAWGDV